MGIFSIAAAVAHAICTTHWATTAGSLPSPRCTMCKHLDVRVDGEGQSTSIANFIHLAEKAFFFQYWIVCWFLCWRNTMCSFFLTVLMSYAVEANIFLLDFQLPVAANCRTNKSYLSTCSWTGRRYVYVSIVCNWLLILIWVIFNGMRFVGGRNLRAADSLLVISYSFELRYVNDSLSFADCASKSILALILPI